MPEFVTLSVADGVGTIRVDRPPVNALDAQCRRELVAAADAASADPQIASVIVTGGDKVFAAGDDIAELARTDLDRMRATVADVQRALGCLATIPKPTVAAISNYALGGGLELALGADRRVAGDNVKLGVPEILLGLIPVGGATQRLARLIGPSRAKDLVLTGRFVEAEEALRIGLIDDMVAPDDVYAAAVRWARTFVGGPAVALAAAKAALNASDSTDPDDGLAVEREQFLTAYAAADRQIGIESFLANGPGRARFTGR